MYCTRDDLKAKGKVEQSLVRLDSKSVELVFKLLSLKNRRWGKGGKIVFSEKFWLLSCHYSKLFKII